LHGSQQIGLLCAPLCVLCVSVVHYFLAKTTTETQNTEGAQRGSPIRDFSCKATWSVFMQRRKMQRRLRLRQVLTLPEL
jgi:hypothetical protein